MSDDRARDGLTEAERDRLAVIALRPWRCCPHCAEDDLHGPELVNAHDLPCDTCLLDRLADRAQRDTGLAAALMGLLTEWESGGAASNPFPDGVVLDVATEVIAPLRALLSGDPEAALADRAQRDTGLAAAIEAAVADGRWTSPDELRALLSGDPEAALAERDRRTEVRVLREAAEEALAHFGTWGGAAWAEWLRDHADRLRDGGAS